MLQFPPVPPNSFRASRSGFTLVELVTVAALIAILSGIALGITGAVHRRAAINRTDAQLALLAAALEDYARQFGDYPQTSDPGQFLAALDGRRGPLGAAVSGRRFIELGSFHLRTPDPEALDNALVDPWGEPYRYAFSGEGGYVLYSVGPDGRDHPPGADGAVDAGYPDNHDNRYAHALSP